MLSSKRRYLWGVGVFAALTVAAGTALAAPGGISQGPSTTTDPYVLPVGDGVSIKSLLTVSGAFAPGEAGTTDDGYKMVGIPDGLGAYEDPETGDFTLLMNHELRDTQGAVRSHGQKGAFVAELGIDAESVAVETGRDLIDPGVRYWNYTTQTYGTTPSTGGVNPRDPTDTFPPQLAAFARFCSSSLTDPGIPYDKRTKKGYSGQIYFGNEENGDEGRVFGVTTNGQAQQLPRLGLFSWENTIAADTKSDLTLTMGNEDGAAGPNGQLWVYLGTKQSTGNAFDRAGLTNGTDYVIDLADEAVSTDAQFRATYGKGNPAPFTLGEEEIVDWDSSGARQNSEAAADGLGLNRIEDGQFDPKHPRDYYFLTTEGGDTTANPDEPTVSRDGGGLWRLRFKNIKKPQLGGTLELLLDGTEEPYLSKPDNMTIDTKGNLLIQEDPGNIAHFARIVAYDVHSGDRGVVAEFDRTKFAPGGTPFTQDEESSGIIDAEELLGKGWFLFDAQVHTANADPALVEYGQLLAMQVRKFKGVYTIDG